LLSFSSTSSDSSQISSYITTIPRISHRQPLASYSRSDTLTYTVPAYKDRPPVHPYLSLPMLSHLRAGQQHNWKPGLHSSNRSQTHGDGTFAPSMTGPGNTLSAASTSLFPKNKRCPSREHLVPHMENLCWIHALCPSTTPTTTAHSLLLSASDRPLAAQKQQAMLATLKSSCFPRSTLPSSNHHRFNPVRWPSGLRRQLKVITIRGSSAIRWSERAWVQIPLSSTLPFAIFELESSDYFFWDDAIAGT
jgi:hypothetical protein